MLVGRNLKKILRNCYSVFKSNLVLLHKVMYSYFNFFVKELLHWINMHWLTKEFLPFQTLRNVFNIKIIKIVNVGFNSLYKPNNRKATVVLTIMLALLISASLLNYSYLEELNEYIHLIENHLSHIDTSNSSELTKPDESSELTKPDESNKSTKPDESNKSTKPDEIDNSNDTEDASNFWDRFDFEEFDDSCEYYELTDFLVVWCLYRSGLDWTTKVGLVLWWLWPR